MDKSNALDRLTFCGECGYWNPLYPKGLKEEYRGYIGCCNRPREAMIERYKDDFCSRGVKRRNENDGK
jgi:hypothetical protein